MPFSHTRLIPSYNPLVGNGDDCWGFSSGAEFCSFHLSSPELSGYSNGQTLTRLPNNAPNILGEEQIDLYISGSGATVVQNAWNGFTAVRFTNTGVYLPHPLTSGSSSLTNSSFASPDHSVMGMVIVPRSSNTSGALISTGWFISLTSKEIYCWATTPTLRVQRRYSTSSVQSNTDTGKQLVLDQPNILIMEINQVSPDSGHYAGNFWFVDGYAQQGASQMSPTAAASYSGDTNFAFSLFKPYSVSGDSSAWQVQADLLSLDVWNRSPDAPYFENTDNVAPPDTKCPFIDKLLMHYRMVYGL